MVDRSGSRADSVISFGPFRLYVDERLLKKGDETLAVGDRALDILIALVERAGEVVTRKELILRVWPGVTVEEANLRVQITGLRKALADGLGDARYVVNVSGRGYCFVAPVTRSPAQDISPRVEAVAAHPLRNLPSRLTRMIGRDGIVRTLSEQLMLWRFVSIVGPGGMGKTTVAVSVAHMLFDDFGGAVFFIDLAALTDPHLVPTAVASALGLVVRTSDPLVSLLTFIDGKKMLLVLDNCEHVIDVVAPLAERVVSEAPQVHVLTTSREALRAEGEHVHLLYALDCPPDDVDLSAAEVLRYPAAQLFMERATASGHASALSDTDAPSVARICQGLDGIALAIEIAAGRAGSYGIQGTMKLLDNRFRLLWQGRRTARPRHQTLNAMLDWSYNLLSEHEKLVLRRLSVFVGNFTIQSAGSVASDDDVDVTSAIVDLTEKSLITATEINGSAYYRLLDTTRAYAGTKLTERGEADRTARRHAIIYSEFLQHDANIQSRVSEHDLASYALHIGNVRVALGWAFSTHGDIAVGVALATWSASLFIGLSLLEECRCWCERALAALDIVGRGTREEMILQEAIALSLMFTRGHSDQVRGAIERGLALAETFEDRARQLRLFAGLELFLIRRGDLRGALALAERGGIVARAARHPAGLVWAEWTLGLAHHGLGNQAAAQWHCERGMALAVELGTTAIKFFGVDQRVRILVNLARTLWLRGFADQARRTSQQAINEAENQDHPVSICMSLVYVSGIFLWIGDLPRASDLIDRLIASAGRHSLDPYHAAGIALKGVLAIARNEAEAGLDLLRTALATLGSEQYNSLSPEIIGAFAEGLRTIGRFEEAFLAVNSIIALATDRGAKFYLAELMRIKALILASMPQLDSMSAMDCLSESIALAREQSALALELRSTTTMARLLSDSGQRDQARRVLTPVHDRFTEGFDTMDLRVSRQLIEELASS